MESKQLFFGCDRSTAAQGAHLSMCESCAHTCVTHFKLSGSESNLTNVMWCNLTNAKWQMQCGKCNLTNAMWQMQCDKCDKCIMTNEMWQLLSGKYKVTNPM